VVLTIAVARNRQRGEKEALKNAYATTLV
jgi:hypothetical protein